MPAAQEFMPARLDLVGRLEAVQLVEQLEHGALDLAVAAAAAVVRARAANAVHLVHEDDRRRVLPANIHGPSQARVPCCVSRLVHDDNEGRVAPANANGRRASAGTCVARAAMYRS